MNASLMIISFGFACILCFMTSSLLNAQEVKCKVLVPEISTSYEGGCKRGLAEGKGRATGVDQYEGEFKKGYPHGKGKYIWKNGNSYEGEWKKGMRDGYGRMIIKMEEKDSTIVGHWSEDNYLGEEKFPYKLNQKSINIMNIRFVRLDKDKNQIEVIFNENGKPISIYNFGVTELSGHYSTITKTDFAKTLNSVTFPFRAEINADGYSFDFTLNQSGRWRITVEVTTRR